MSDRVRVGLAPELERRRPAADQPQVALELHDSAVEPQAADSQPLAPQPHDDLARLDGRHRQHRVAGLEVGREELTRGAEREP
jgi:hypothetical protein